jgi:DNA helicase HerA-like ATPase
LASCIIETFNSSDSPVSKYQKIQSLIARGTFTANIDDGYNAQYGNFPQDGIKQQAFLDAINGFLLKTHFEIPSFDNTNFNFKEFGDYLDLAILYEESHGNKQIRDYCSSLITRFKSIQERSEFSFLIGQNTVKLDDFLRKIIGLKGKKKEKQVIILDLNSAEDEVVEIVSAVITRLIFNHLKNLGNDKRNKFPINLVLEEAHRYISIDTQRNSFRASYVFERVAKEGRKYGLFLLVSSQRPSELSRTVLSQCNNFIVHRIQNPDDLSHIRQITPHISESTLKKLPSIPTQHALIFGSAVNIPTLYKVKNAHPLPLSDNNRVSDNWFVDKDHKFEI